MSYGSVMGVDELHALGRLVRIVLRDAKPKRQRLTTEQICSCINARQEELGRTRRYNSGDVYEALSISLSGWVASEAGKWWLL